MRASRWFRWVRALPESVQDRLRAIHARHRKALTFYDYDRVWEQIVAVREDTRLATYPGSFADWDNTARYRNRATIFRGASPDRFACWFRRLVDSMEARRLPENFIFFNAWNEWAEGAYLEPDESHGDAYLRAIQQVLQGKESGNE